MFRIPSIGEIVALFTKNKTVASAVADITGAIKRLDDVIAHHSKHAINKGNEAADLQSQAQDLQQQASDRNNEADRAFRIGAKLADLVA